LFFETTKFKRKRFEKKCFLTQTFTPQRSQIYYQSPTLFSARQSAVEKEELLGAADKTRLELSGQLDRLNTDCNNIALRILRTDLQVLKTAVIADASDLAKLNDYEGQANALMRDLETTCEQGAAASTITGGRSPRTNNSQSGSRNSVQSDTTHNRGSR
jgi:hypothetical protein